MRKAVRLCAAALTVALLPYNFAVAGPSSAQEYVTKKTTSGLVRGKVLPGGVELFEGIPYAAPPVGTLRFKAPQRPASWSGVRDAFAPGAPCPQASGLYASTNEDCLYLNIWAPRRASKVPVMVWIHGGGQASSASNDYHGDWLVTRGREPVIVVTFNYRLNIFGFFAHPALTAELPKLGSGNYTGLDQVQVLKWVRENIVYFGGDPNNVTIFGESGGGVATCVLMVSPAAAGLFHRAISESAPCQQVYSTFNNYLPLSSAEARGVTVAKQLGCTDPDPTPCLRALPTSAIMGATGAFAGISAWGGGFFPLPIRHAIAAGRFNRVPFLQGTNRLEWMVSANIAPADYPTEIKNAFGASRVDAIVAAYPLSDYATPAYALSAALTDSGYNFTGAGLCTVHLANQIMAPYVPLYAYVFSDETAPFPAPMYANFGPSPSVMPGAMHTKEMSYLFNQGPLTPAQRRISDVMINYWTNFAAHGDPNAKYYLPKWPRYGATDGTKFFNGIRKNNERGRDDDDRNAQGNQQWVMNFESNEVVANTSLYARHKCKFWNEQGFGLLYGPYATPSSRAALQ